MMRLETARLIFGQHRATTWELFAPEWRTVPVERWPHVRALHGDGDAFRRYLGASWAASERNDVEATLRRLLTMADTDLDEPIDVCPRGDHWLVVDGNHRAAIAAYHGHSVEAREITPDEWVRRIVSNPHLRWGTRPGRPYQTVVAGGARLCRGRRDLSDRHRLLRSDDLKGKRVLDIGCNLGASAVYAHEQGATVEGWDSSWCIVTSAVRLAVLLDYAIEYRVVDVERPRPGEWDTGFCFAVHEHADVRAALRQCGVAYLETHRDQRPPVTLTEGRDEELLGHTDAGRRRLYRMVRR